LPRICEAATHEVPICGFHREDMIHRVVQPLAGQSINLKPVQAEIETETKRINAYQNCFSGRISRHSYAIFRSLLN